MSPLVGVLGGAGTVGRVAVDRLVASGARVRVGGRDVAKARAVPGAAEAVRADLADPAALAAFCRGCAVVLNCAGPSYAVLDVVARAALAAGADYVDAAGDAVAVEALTSSPAPGLDERSAVFSAGLMPGLSGLLPRLLADDAVDRLDVYVGGSVEISALSAVDALLTRGPRFGHALARWRDGAVEEHSLAPLRSVRLPGFQGKVHAWPFLSTEMTGLASALGVRELRNYTVYATENLPEVLATAWADDGPIDAHVDAVVDAARRDVAECGRQYAILAHARAADGSKRVLLRTPDSYELSGVVAAIVVADLLAGRIRPGAHYAADVLDPRRTADLLATDPLVTDLELPRTA